MTKLLPFLIIHSLLPRLLRGFSFQRLYKMWSAIITGISTVFNGYIETKKAKQQAEAAYHMALAKGEQDWDIEAQKAARYSWKDELITIVWFAPLIMAWFNPVKAQDWVNFVAQLPYFYQFVMFGIVAASFGLRWYFNKQNFNIPKSAK